jgi:hypothetical protein
MIDEEKRQSVLKRLKGDIKLVKNKIDELNYEKKLNLSNLKALKKSLKEIENAVS